MRKWIQVMSSAWMILIFFSFGSIASAQENKIESIHIEIELQEDGSAIVQEERQMEMHEDTELYIEMVNLGESELLNFQVEGFTEEEDWDIDASFEEKAYRYGVIDTDDGYELAWGISEYGPQEYQVEYTLSNLVRELEDGQGLFWNFDTFLSLPTDRLTLEVSAPFPLEEEVLDFYGFGFEGPLEMVDGTLEWTGFGLDDGHDIILLVQFPSGTFNTQVSEDMTLAEQQEMATAGSSYNDEEPMPTWVKFLVGGLGVLGASGGGLAIAYGIKTHNIKKEKHHFFPAEVIKENRGVISQTPPQLEGDISDYAYLISQVVVSGGSFSNYFFAYLLLWSLEDRIQVETREEERFILGPETQARIQINNLEGELEMTQLTFDEAVDLYEMGEATLEEVVWTILLELADARGIVEGSRVEHWSEENAESLNDLVQLVEEVSKNWLLENGYLNKEIASAWGLDVKVEALTEKGERLVNEVIQFDNFIENMDEVSLSAFDNWHELIVWAALFGKAEETVEYLEEFEPSTWAYLEETYPYVYGHYYGWHYFYLNYSSGVESAGYSSAGAGGFSSAGGGMGAGGGGGGGSR